MVRTTARITRTILRAATGRRARRAYAVIFLLLVTLSCAIRVRSVLLTRKIERVVAALHQLRLDRTPEAELLHAIPTLGLGEARKEEGVTWRRGGLVLSNMEDWYWIVQHCPIYWPIDPYSSEPRTSKWQSLSLPLWAAYVVGWWHISFEAYVTVTNGVVSGVEYDMDPDVLMGFPSARMISVRSVHAEVGPWPVRVADVDDEAPDGRFGGAGGALTPDLGRDGAIGLAYTTDAPTDVVSHAFEPDLSCFWALFGCHSARQVLPRLWDDREAVMRAAAQRLASADPCPDRILAGRVRRLADLVIERREVIDPILAGASSPVVEARDSRPGYRLEAVIPDAGKWFATFSGWAPGTPRGGFLWQKDPAAPPLKRGDKVLVFLGADFQSCRVVPATASAEAAIRAAVPAPMRPEDRPTSFGRQ